MGLLFYWYINNMFLAIASPTSRLINWISKIQAKVAWLLLELSFLQVLVHGCWLRYLHRGHGIHMETEDTRATETHHETLKQSTAYINTLRPRQNGPD